MYNYIKGTLVAAEPGMVVLENNGIGYELGVSGNTLADADRIGKEMKLYTYLYVREDVFSLYGFSRAEEKTLFMRLIDISGVGPKLAMQILGGYDLGTLTVAIATGDIKTLSTILGHVSSATTLNTYSHVTDEMRQRAAVKIDQGIAKAEVQDTAIAQPERIMTTFQARKRWSREAS